ncbi:uncharacterized protein LOC135501620 [Lineus longissimus]|uniref:uncharacterized protein LOC135501620 n=1 Tax=Lineus longissimus TaxID=88925 RepID=UPI00315D7610
MSSCGSWLLLGPRIESKPSGLGGLTLSTVGATTLTTGPEGINAWVFTGHNYVKITSDGKLDIERDSFTIATYLYQDVLRDEIIVEWRGRGDFGTHMCIYQGKLLINMDAHTGRSLGEFHIAPPTKKWSFVGISYSQQTGNLVMWVDGNVVIKNVGAIGLRDMLGDLYVGLRPANGGSKFTGKLAGTTLMRCAVSGKAQIEELRKLIISRAKPGGMSSCGSWLLLGPRIESKPSGLGGLTLSTVGATTLTTGPEGINAWVFTGHNYVKITSDGKLDIERDSFTIATYLYQDVLRDEAIVEWRGRGDFGTHMWIYQEKLLINMDAHTGRSLGEFHIAPPT